MPRSLAPIDPFASARRAFVDAFPATSQRLGWSADQVACTSDRGAARPAAHRHRALAIPRPPARRRSATSNIRDRRPRTPAGDDEGEMMDVLRRVTTDRRLTRDAVEAFLATSATSRRRFRRVPRARIGRSSGVRGVFAWPLDLVPDYLAAILRGRARPRRRRPGPPPGCPSPWSPPARPSTPPGSPPTSPTARSAPHLRPGHPAAGRDRAPAEAAQPALLAGYATSLERRRRAARRPPSIRPAMVVTTSEQLTDDARGRRRGVRHPARPTPSVHPKDSTARPARRRRVHVRQRRRLRRVRRRARPARTDRHAGPPRARHEPAQHHPAPHPVPARRHHDAAPAVVGSGHQRATLDGRTDEVVRSRPRHVHPIVVRTVLAHHAEAPSTRCAPRPTRWTSPSSPQAHSTYPAYARTSWHHSTPPAPPGSTSPSPPPITSIETLTRASSPLHHRHGLTRRQLHPTTPHRRRHTGVRSTRRAGVLTVLLGHRDDAFGTLSRSAPPGSLREHPGAGDGEQPTRLDSASEPLRHCHPVGGGVLVLVAAPSPN